MPSTVYYQSRITKATTAAVEAVMDIQLLKWVCHQPFDIDAVLAEIKQHYIGIMADDPDNRPAVRPYKLAP